MRCIVTITTADCSIRIGYKKRVLRIYMHCFFLFFFFFLNILILRSYCSYVSAVRAHLLLIHKREINVGL
jgi:hypothetical protein